MGGKSTYNRLPPIIAIITHDITKTYYKSKNGVNMKRKTKRKTKRKPTGGRIVRIIKKINDIFDPPQVYYRDFKTGRVEYYNRPTKKGKGG